MPKVGAHGHLPTLRGPHRNLLALQSVGPTLCESTDYKCEPPQLCSGLWTWWTMINRKIDTTPHRQRHAPERCRQHCFCYQCPRPLFMIFDIVQLSQHTQQAGVQDRCTTVICHASISSVQSLPSCAVFENQCLRFLYNTPQQHTTHRCQLLKKQR